MKTTIILFALLLISHNLFAQNCPLSIKVGLSCSCHTCPISTTEVVDFEEYVKRSLSHEWVESWGDYTGGMDALQAGAIAIRSYAVARFKTYKSAHGNGKYSIGSTIYLNNVVDNTEVNIDLSIFTAGVYTVKTETKDGKVYIQKLVKQ